MVNEDSLARHMDEALNPPRLKAINNSSGDAEKQARMVKVRDFANPDTGATSRIMKESMQKMIASLESEIADYEAVRDTINENIRDKQRALATARTAFTVVMTSG